MASRLYKILGIDKGASEAEIKTAYRKKAKATHPDAGGEVETFQEVAKAFHILSDPQRRIAYDETGIEEPAAKPEDAAIAILRNLVQSIIMDNADPAYVDMAAQMRKSISDAINQQRQSIAVISARLTRCEKMANRFSVKSGENIVAAMIVGHLSEMRQHIAGAKQNMIALEAARRLIEGFSYKTDANPHQAGQLNWMLGQQAAADIAATFIRAPRKARL